MIFFFIGIFFLLYCLFKKLKGENNGECIECKFECILVNMYNYENEYLVNIV